MIHFFATQRDTLEKFIASWAPELGPRVRTRSYCSIPLLRSLPSGGCIFADYERLGPWRFAQAQKLRRRLDEGRGGHRILNDPARYVRRFELMQRLHAQGINEFRAHRVGRTDGSLKFPVFLRSEVDHRGAITGLLHSPDDLQRALSWLSLLNRLRMKHLMVVEYCDCADAAGVFRKYSAMNINGTLIPRHVLFSRNWVTKKPDLVGSETVDEEIDFIERFPHREELAAIFRLAGVDYGRVDYGLKQGRIQVWEINTNPVVVPRRERVDTRRLASQSGSARQIAQALLALDA